MKLWTSEPTSTVSQRRTAEQAKAQVRRELHEKEDGLIALAREYLVNPPKSPARLRRFWDMFRRYTDE